ncbi:MAG: hypothetical protein HXS46_04765 [Theionarchaea archaeon]|nr:hypothetical protein [Theionarchaea archaeon]
MKKVCYILILIILFSSVHVSSRPSQELFLTYGIYYGQATDIKMRNRNWSQFDLMILHPGIPQTDYKNLDDPAFLIMMQTMRDAGVEIYLYQDIGCEKDSGGLYYSQTEREDWIKFKKREINLFMRYADGIFFDCIGPAYGGHTYSEQFGRDVQELVDHAHYSGGKVIVSNLWMLMDWVESGNLDLIPYEAEYVLLEGAWSMTPHQYSDDWDPLSAIFFARSNNLKILGLDFGEEEDRERFMYCYCASRVFGFSGFYYAEDLYEPVNELDVPFLGAPLGDYVPENGSYTREFRKGTVYVNFQAHKGWIEGEAAAEEASASAILVLAGILLGLYQVRKAEKATKDHT